MIPANNFDLLRFVFAFSVFLHHAQVLSGADELSFLSRLLSTDVAVKGFFVVSGYLVTMSYQGSRSLQDYAQKRLRRLYPAYLTVIVLAVALGAAVTSLPWREYFSAGVVRYLAWNAVFLNFVAPTLPGVFAGNPWVEVNGALWTLKIEVMFYALVPIMVWLCLRMRAGAVLIGLYLGSALYAEVLTHLAEARGSVFLEQLSRQLPGQLRYFIVGAAGWFFRGALASRWHSVGTAGAALFIGLRLAGSPRIDIWLEPAALGALVLWGAFGLRHLGNFGRRGDLSYGVYIIHFPVLQTLVALGLFNESPWVGLASAVALVIALAALSWHLVEKPFLRRSSHYRLAEAGRA